MRNFLKAHATKLLSGAALAGLIGVGATTANAAVLIDVRQTTTNSKNIIQTEGSTAPVSLSIFVLEQGGNTLQNGLGAYALSLRSFLETNGGGSFVPASNTDAVVNATAGTISNPQHSTGPGSTDGQFTNTTRWDGLNSSGVLIDLPAAVDPDGDIDRRGHTGLQDPNDIDGDDVPDAGGFELGLGKTTELLLGTVTFTPTTGAAAGTYPRSVHLNAFKSDAAGSNGGVALSALGASTSDVNSLNAVAFGDINIGSDVVLTINPVPEPASLGLLAIAGLATLRRRRQA